MDNIPKKKIMFLEEVKQEIMKQFEPKRRMSYSYTMRCIFCGAPDLFHLNVIEKTFHCYYCERMGKMEHLRRMMES